MRVEAGRAGKGDLHQSSEEAARPREDARDAYNRMSRIYDFLTSGAESRITGKGIDLLSPSQGESVLEIGCGTGKGLVRISSLVGPEGKVKGVDISKGMLDVASRRIREAGLEERIELKEADAVSLPFEDSSFDAVFMSFTLELFSSGDMIAVLSECHRVLKENGRIGIVSMSARGDSSIMRKAYLWAHIRFPKYVDCRPIYAERMLEENGFTVTEALLESLYGLPVEIVAGKEPAKKK